jgi:hypothetical protein
MASPGRKNSGKDDPNERIVCSNRKARYEYDVKMMFIYPNPLRKWCSERQINYEWLTDSLKRGRTKAKLDKKRMAKGTHMSLPSLDVWWINCEGFLDDDKEQALAAVAEHKATLEGDT